MVCAEIAHTTQVLLYKATCKEYLQVQAEEKRGVRKINSGDIEILIADIKGLKSSKKKYI